MGTRVSRKRVARLMGERGIQGATRRKGFKTTWRGRGRHGIPDRVERSFAAEAPNQLWVATRRGAGHNPHGARCFGWGDNVTDFDGLACTAWSCPAHCA